MGEMSPPSASLLRRIKGRAAWLALCTALAVAFLTVSATAQSLPRTVLYLDQGPSNNPAARAISGAFQAKLDDESGSSVFVYPENLAIPIFGSARYFDLLHDHFREKYRGRPIGIIVVRGTATLSYALRLRDALWPGTALVFTSVGETTVDKLKLPPNVTGLRRTPGSAGKRAGHPGCSARGADEALRHP